MTRASRKHVSLRRRTRRIAAPALVASGLVVGALAAWLPAPAANTVRFVRSASVHAELVSTPVLPVRVAAVAAARKESLQLTAPRGVRGSTFPEDLVAASGSQLVLYGKPYRFVSVNAYEIGTDWGVNAGCGGMLSNEQLNDFFASLPPDSLVRFWAYQGTMATSINTHQLDWAPIDRVVAAAAAHGQRLIFSLTGQGSSCDGANWQGPSWYNGGFMDVYNSASNSNGSGLDPLSYWQYVKDIVTRYRDSPAVGMWEPISEPEASTCPPQYEPTNCQGHQTCPDEHAAALALRHFFDVVGGEIHRLDPNHLVESGTIGSGQCGTIAQDWLYLAESPGIDVLSYHDYYSAGTALGGDQWNGLAVRLQEAQAVGKPMIVGELGIQANADGSADCPSLAQRAADVQAKASALFADGAAGILIWDWLPAPSTTDCVYDTYPGDPLLAQLGTLTSSG